MKSLFWLPDFVSLIFPRHCITCRSGLVDHEKFICLNCSLDLPKTGYIGMEDNPVTRIFTGRMDICHASAWLNFEKGNKTQQLMHELKYRNKPEVGHFLGKLMGADIKVCKNLPMPDVVIPVPIHKTRRRHRGYNQSDHIANGIAEALEIPSNTTSLKRRTKSESQTKKKRYERWENVSNVFEWTGNDKEYNHILLVDDVVTTGATIEACYHAIRTASDCKISVMTLARSN